MSSEEILAVAWDLKNSRSPTEPLRLHVFGREEEEGLQSEHPQVAADREQRVAALRTELLALSAVSEPPLQQKQLLLTGQSVAEDMNNNSLNKLTVPELKNRLRERGLQVSGLKAELVSRLKSSTTDSTIPTSTTTTTSTTTSTTISSGRLFFTDGDAAHDGERVLDVIVGEPGEKALAFVGTRLAGRRHRLTQWSTPFPNNNPRTVKLPPDSPSRAFLKTEEAIQTLCLPMKEGESALEIGSAPGGSALALMLRGLKVIGVDPCPADRTHSPVVLSRASTGQFREIKAKLHQFKLDALPDRGASVSWVLCDANIEADEAVLFLGKICAAIDSCRPASAFRGLLLTVKMGSSVTRMEPPRVLQYLANLKSDLAEASKGVLAECNMRLVSRWNDRQEILLLALAATTAEEMRR